MWWRLKRSVWEKQKGNGNRKAFKKIVESGEVPGLLAYVRGQPAGWICVESREAFPVLENSRILKSVDEQPVWSVVCLFVSKPFRRKGLSVELLRAAIAHAMKRGAKIVEGYPNDPGKGAMPDAFAFMGLVSAFREARFQEVARRSPGRPIMRYTQ